QADVDTTSPEPVATQPLPAQDLLERASELLRGAQRPAIMAGTNVYWAGAEAELEELAEDVDAAVFLNGLGRGRIPAAHPNAFSRARGKGLGEADVALVVGVPMDFRLGFGEVFGPDTKVVVIDVAPPTRPHPRAVAVELYGNVPATLTALAKQAG